VENGWASPIEARTLNPGANGVLQLNYSGANAAPNGYILVIEFDNGCLLSDVR
jgi:hypothetical protein